MVICQLCGIEFKSERGIAVHLARTHDIRGSRGRLSLKAAYRFFPLLRERRWVRAERFLKGEVIKGAIDVWKRGYAHALKGMIIVLRSNRSPAQPYILQLKRYDRRQLQEAEQQFIEQSKTPSKTEFDQGYFQAWIDYIHYLLHQRREQKRKAQRNTKGRTPNG